MRPAPADDVTLDDKSEDGESEFQQDSSPFDALGLSDETDALLIEFVNDPEQLLAVVEHGMGNMKPKVKLIAEMTAEWIRMLVNLGKTPLTPHHTQVLAAEPHPPSSHSAAPHQTRPTPRVIL